MDKKIEKLVEQIMCECEQDGEPVTREEAEEMAEMEIKSKEIKRYEQSDKPKEKKVKIRKVDEEKKYILECVEDLLKNIVKAEINVVKTETEISFNFNNNDYTIKLTKHRPPKI